MPAPKRSKNLRQGRRNLSAEQWHKRIGEDAVEVYSPTLHRVAYITEAEAQLLSIPALQIGWHVSFRRLRPLTRYRSVSGLWRAVATLTSLGLIVFRVRAGISALRVTVRTLVRDAISPVVGFLKERSMVRTGNLLPIGDVLSRLFPAARVGADRVDGIIEGRVARPLLS